MVENGIEKLAGFWGSHRGLVVLLLAGLTVSLLALAAPQVWATPDQNPLLQTLPPVGGETVPASTLTLLAPVLGLMLAVGGVVAAAIVWKRRHG